MEHSDVNAGGASLIAPAARGRRRGPSSALADPGLAVVVGGLLLAVVGSVAVWVGWSAVLLAVLLVQVVVARSWVEWLEVPASTACSVAVLAVAGIADLGVLLARAEATPPFERADDLLQLAPAAAAVFLVGIAVQLLRHDDPDGDGPRPGAVAGMVATTTGGAIVIGLAMWLPLLAARSGAELVLVGVGAAAVLVVGIGTVAWVRRSYVAPAGVIAPVVLALLAGPFWVVGRIVHG